MRTTTPLTASAEASYAGCGGGSAACSNGRRQQTVGEREKTERHGTWQMSYRIWEIQYAGSPKLLWSGVKPTSKQLATADQLGLQVSPHDTFAAVASAILEMVGDAVGCPPRAVSDRQRELADELEIDLMDCASSWSAFMRIQEAIQLSNLDAVRRMGLKPGDIVFKPDDPLEQRLKERLGESWESVAGQFPREFEVSSIREDGQVCFKGVVRKRPPAIWRSAPLPKGSSRRTYEQVGQK